MGISKVYIGNLKYEVTNEELTELFGKMGEIKNVAKIETKNYAFIEFETEEAAEKAVNELNGVKLSGRPMRVEISAPKDKGNRGGRRPFNKRKRR